MNTLDNNSKIWNYFQGCANSVWWPSAQYQLQHKRLRHRDGQLASLDLQLAGGPGTRKTHSRLWRCLRQHCRCDGGEPQQEGAPKTLGLGPSPPYICRIPKDGGQASGDGGGTPGEAAENSRHRQKQPVQQTNEGEETRPQQKWPDGSGVGSKRPPTQPCRRSWSAWPAIRKKKILWGQPVLQKEILRKLCHTRAAC